MGGIGLGGGYGQSSASQKAGYDVYTSNARDWAQQVLQHPETLPASYFYSGLGPADIGNLTDVAGQLRALSGAPGFGSPNTLESAGLNTLKSATDLTALKNAYRSYFGSIVSPSILASLTAAGQGRSGAQAEAQALAGSNIGAQLATLANQRTSELGGAQLDLGKTLPQMVLQALTQSGNLYGLGSQIQNAYNVADLQSGRAQNTNILANLLNMLRPLQTKGTTSGSGWNIAGSASYGAPQNLSGLGYSGAGTSLPAYGS